MFSKKLFKLVLYIYVMCMIIIMFIAGCQIAKGQNVIRNGNTFVQISDSSSKIKKDEPTLTKYTYIATDGKKYPIWISSKGKCFIKRISKKGKEWRQYLPEITKQLSK